MKIKKWFCLTLVCVCILLSSQSVLADSYDDGVTTWEILKNTNEFYSGYLDSSDDVDFYRWTNNRGGNVIATLHVASLYKNYDIAQIGQRGDRFGIDHGSLGAIDSVSINVTAGDMVFWKVVPHTSNDFSLTQNYWTWISYKYLEY